MGKVATITAPVRHAGTLHVATGQWSRTTTTYGVGAADTLYRNDLPANLFAAVDEDDFLTDEGRLPGLNVPLLPREPEVGTSDHYRVTGFEVGYCSLSSNPTSLGLQFLNRYSPCTDPSEAGMPVADFEFTGLPNNGCWVFAIDLEGSELDFLLDAEGGDGSFDGDTALDSFGMRFSLDAGQGSSSTGDAGLILAGDFSQTATIGAGTTFSSTPGPGTGLGNLDSFWLESPSQPDGCYWYGGCLPCAAYSFTLFGEPASGATAYCSSGSNSVNSAGAELDSLGGYRTSNAVFEVRDTPDQVGFLFSGPRASQTPFGCGELCVGGGGLVRYGPFVPQGNQLNAAIDMSLAPSHTFVQWWYFDPDNAASCGSGFNLSNAIQQ